MTKICEKMNLRNRMARYASRASSDYHTYMFFKDRKNTEKAIITAITEDSLTLMLIKYGLESKIAFSESEKKRVGELNSGRGVLTEAEAGGKVRKLFEYLEVEVQVELRGFHKVMEMRIVG